MSEPAEHPEDRPRSLADTPEGRPDAGAEDRPEVRAEDQVTEPIAAAPEDTPASFETAPAPQPLPYSGPPLAPPPTPAASPSGVAPPVAGPPPVVAPAPPVAPNSARRSGLFTSRWVLAATTGVAGLLIGVLIGAVGVGLIGLIRHHGGPPRGDNRGQYQPDHRPRGGLPNGNQPAPGFR